MTRTFCIVYPADGMLQVDGKLLSEPPLHCNAVPWFVLQKCQVNQFRDFLVHRAARVGAAGMPLVAAHRAMYGPHEDVPVTVLQRSNPLLEFHMDLHRHLVSLGAEFQDPHWVGEGYSPHVSDVGAQKFALGTTYVAKGVFAVERYPSGAKRLILQADFFPK
jgi:hypothetical protein